MRRLNLDLDEIPIGDSLFRFSRTLPGGVLFPRLEWLRWGIDESYTHIPIFSLFLPPHLKRVILYYNTSPRPMRPLPLPKILIQIISSLPTSLEDLSVMCHGGRGEEPLKDAISSFVCRCGPSLRRIGTSVPISEAALHYLMRLPNLSSWRTVQGPPRVIPTFIFPSLDELRLDKQETLPWLHLLPSHQRGTLQNGSTSTTSDANTRGTLKTLDLPATTTVDSTLLSSFARFWNLVTLRVRTRRSSGMEGCTFYFTDNDVENLASALPRLNSLRLGVPCDGGSCSTTIASLMSVSVHCLDLEVLEIHFNTRTIVGDIRHMLDGDAGRDKAKCQLQRLSVGSLLLQARGEDIKSIAMGLKVIFPHLKNIAGCHSRWRRVNV